MDVFSLVVALLVVCVYSFFLKKYSNAPVGVLPFVVICASLVFFCLMGYANLLFVAGIVWYTGAVVCLAFVVFGKKNKITKTDLTNYFSPAILVFISTSIFMIIVLAINTPALYRWDEFSFWGTAAKLLNINDTLYSMEASSFLGKLGYPAGLPVVSYVFQFLSNTFCDWAAMAAYNILIFSGFAAVLSSITKKHIRSAVFLFFVIVTAPFIFEIAPEGVAHLSAYRTLLSELPCAVMFGGVLALYFSQKQKSVFCLSSVAVSLAALSLTKDVGFVLAAIAVFCIGVDLIFANSEHITINKIKTNKKVLAVLIAVLLLIICLVSFFSWGMHVSAVSGIDRNNVGAGDTELSMVTVVVGGLKQLVGIGTTARFSQTLDNMIAAFFSIKVSTFGSGATVAIFISAILVFAAFCAGKKSAVRKSAICFLATGFVGLLGLFVFYLFAYTYVFGEAEGLMLLDYRRYIAVYYVGWFITAVCFLGLVLNEKMQKTARAAVLAIFILFVALNIATINIKTTVLAKNPSLDDGRQLIAHRAEQIKNTCIEKNDNVYIISQWDNSAIWYQYAYELLPIYCEKPVDGTIILPSQEKSKGATQISVVDFCDFLVENKCNYLFLDTIDEYVTVEMLPLFTDNLVAYNQQGVRLYTINNIDGKVTFSPCAEVK